MAAPFPMTIAERLERIREHLGTAVAGSERREVVYQTEWLGYLPYGAYQWIEAEERDVTSGMPPDWELGDLLALEREGFLERLEEWRDPEDPQTLRRTYRVTSRGAC
jgi:hypothetical protein